MSVSSETAAAAGQPIPFDRRSLWATEHHYVNGKLFADFLMAHLQNPFSEIEGSLGFIGMGPQGRERRMFIPIQSQCIMDEDISLHWNPGIPEGKFRQLEDTLLRAFVHGPSREATIGERTETETIFTLATNPNDRSLRQLRVEIAGQLPTEAKTVWQRRFPSGRKPLMMVYEPSCELDYALMGWQVQVLAEAPTDPALLANPQPRIRRFRSFIFKKWPCFRVEFVTTDLGPGRCRFDVMVVLASRQQVLAEKQKALQQQKDNQVLVIAISFLNQLSSLVHSLSPAAPNPVGVGSAAASLPPKQ